MKLLVFQIVLSLTLVLAGDLDEFSKSNREFSANIYRELAAENSGNFLGCPMSTEIVLSMVHAGARHQTAEQLAKGLFLPNSNSAIAAMMQAALPHLKSELDVYTLKTANKMYLAPNFEIKDDFKQTVVNVFKAEIENIDFSDTVKAAGEMNAWVAGETDNYIKDLLKPNDISGSTHAVILNALYFQANWNNAFLITATKKSSFYTSKVGNVEVEMMDATESYEYYESQHLKAKFLKMSYTVNDLAMVVVLPDDKDGLDQLEANMHEVLQEQSFTWQKVHVKFPRFKMDATIKLIPILKKLGIVEVFSSGADLSGITSVGSLFVSNVVQKNFIEVNEKGTIAASATAAIMDLYSAHDPRPPKEFFADHPFIYYIKSAAGILFVGRFAGH